MRPFLLSLCVLLSFAAVGCDPTQHTGTTEEKSARPTGAIGDDLVKQPAPAQPQAPAAGGGSGDVQIHSMGAGAATPVTGTENLMGSGGGGVASAAKDQAKKVGGTAGSSLDQLPQGE